jgi:hypothetical protein
MRAVFTIDLQRSADRLLHQDLARLQSSTEKIIKEIVATRLHDRPLSVSDSAIEVYERMFDNVILTGRVITHALRETITSDAKNSLLSDAHCARLTFPFRRRSLRGA